MQHTGRASRETGFRRIAPLAAAMIGALLLAGCGDGEDDSAEAPPAATVEAPVPPAPIPEPTPAPIVPAEPAAAPIEPVAAPIAEPAPTPAAPVAPAPTATPPVPVPAAPAADAAPPAAQIAPGMPAPPAAFTGADPAPDTALRVQIAAADPAAGAGEAALCLACHTASSGAGALVGPNLWDIVGRPVGSVAGFAYSPEMAALGAAGATWTVERLDAFLEAPAATVPGTRMALAGVADETRRIAIVAWLRNLAVEPVALTEPGGVTRGTMLPGLQPISFTAEQVPPGRDYYTRFCARCHGADFVGLVDTREWGSAPALIGPRFDGRWQQQTVWDLVLRMRDNAAFPVEHGGLTIERYTQLLAYIFEQQGFVAGTIPLPSDQAALETMGFYQR